MTYLTLGIKTADPSTKAITIKIYADMNDNGTLEAGAQFPVVSTIPWIFPVQLHIQLALLVSPLSQQPIMLSCIIVWWKGRSGYSIYKTVDRTWRMCTVAVNFKSFTAQGIISLVGLKWKLYRAK